MIARGLGMIKASMGLQFMREPKLYRVNAYNFASFKEKMEKKQKEKATDEFKKEIEFLANKPSFTLVDFKQRIVDSLAKMKKGIKAKLMNNQQEEEALLTKQKTMLNAITDDELLDSSKIGQVQKKQISMIAQCDVEDVNKLLDSYRNLKQSHSFLRKTKEKGQPLPESAEELHWKFRQERDISYEFRRKIQESQRGRSKKQYGKIQKWSRRLQL